MLPPQEPEHAPRLAAPRRADGKASAAEESLFHVFDKRTMAKLPTMWTTENSQDELKKRLSMERVESFVARLKEFSQKVFFGAVKQPTKKG